MNSFTLHAVGHLARNPELITTGETSYARFCLIGNDYAGKDEEGAAQEVVTSAWFTAFGALGEVIARNTRKGDQLIVQARLRTGQSVDKHGERQFEHSFIVQGFRFGAPGKLSRHELEAGAQDEPASGAAEA
jgi:single-stranded DNA-binding protein